MLAADHALVAADPALPGLAALLDDECLRRWLARHAPEHALTARRYLRYKPGTSCVLGLELRGPAGTQRAVLMATSADAAVKLDKTVELTPDASVLARDERRHLLLGTAAADRDLPALAALDRDRGALLGALLPDGDFSPEALRTTSVRTLSHKPQRRWVGLLRPAQGPPVLLRAHRPAVAGTTVEVLHALAADPPRTPTLLGSDPALGVVAVTHLPGRVLDEALRARTVGPADVAEAGAALARLHGSRRPGLRQHPQDRAVQAVHAAAAAAGALLPAVAERALRLAAHLDPALTASGYAPCHGDFSLDQVVLGPGSEVGLVDLDDAGQDDPATDLAAAVAAATTHHPYRVGEVGAALRSGYRRHRELPPAHRLAAHTAAQLMSRAVEPFRLAHPRWPDELHRLLAAAEATAGREVRS